MNRRRIAVATFAACLVPAHVVARTSADNVCAQAAAAVEFTSPAPPPVAPTCRLDQGCLQVDWNIAARQPITDTLKLFRFTEKTPLRIHTTNVNLLQFTVTWTQVVEEQIKGFEGAASLIEGLTPVLNLAAAAAGGVIPFSTPTGRERFAKWVTALELANACMLETIGIVNDVVIDRDGFVKRARLHETHAIIAHALPKLLGYKTQYLETVAKSMSTNDLETYLKMSQRHDDFQKRATEFLPLARNSVDGVTTVMSAEKRNSVVVLTGQATKRDGEKVGQAVTARYFVAWSRPVSYHVGYGYGRLKDFDFKQVRTLSGQDLFAATEPVDAEQAADTTGDAGEPEAVAFLTWELIRIGPNDRYGLGFTAGTGLGSPGDSIYYGGTARIFSRLLVTFGAVSARATRGEGPVIDTTTSPASTRTLFAELKERTATNPFWSVSFKVY